MYHPLSRGLDPEGRVRTPDPAGTRALCTRCATSESFAERPLFRCLPRVSVEHSTDLADTEHRGRGTMGPAGGAEKAVSAPPEGTPQRRRDTGPCSLPPREELFGIPSRGAIAGTLYASRS